MGFCVLGFFLGILDSSSLRRQSKGTSWQTFQSIVKLGQEWFFKNAGRILIIQQKKNELISRRYRNLNLAQFTVTFIRRKN